MKPILSPSSRRCAALRRYEILDTLPEAEFDDLTALAAQLWETPMAAITFLDDRRQWFKSRIAVPQAETTVEESFCIHTISQALLTAGMVVPDAAADPRFSQSPLVTGAPHIRFYAGAPLLTPEGCPIGALCVMDSNPRRDAPGQKRDALRILAEQVILRLEHRGTITILDQTLREKAAAAARIRQLEQLLPDCPCEKPPRATAEYWTWVDEFIQYRQQRGGVIGTCQSCRTRRRHVQWATSDSALITGPAISRFGWGR